jgi:hypothetical protein
MFAGSRTLAPPARAETMDQPGKFLERCEFEDLYHRQSAATTVMKFLGRAENGEPARQEGVWHEVLTAVGILSV